MNIKKIITLGLILILSFPMLYLPFSVNADTDQASNEFNPDDYIIVETIEYQDGTKETIMTRDGKTSIEIVDPVENPTEVGLVSPISITDPGGPPGGNVGADADCELFDYYGGWVWIFLVPVYVYYKFVFKVWCKPRGLAGIWTDNLREAKFRIKVSGDTVHYEHKEPGSFLWVKSYTFIMYRITPIPMDWAGRSYEGYCWAKDDDCCDIDFLDGGSETKSDTCTGTIEPIPNHGVELEILGIGGQPIYDDQLAGGLFRITNHGDFFSERFHISCPGLDKASATYSHNDFWLDPGEDKTFSITLDPTDVGTDDFKVRVTSYTYGTTDSVDCSITIIDDDDIPPVVTIQYTGDGTDGDPGEIIVTASDASGLSVDPSGTYEVLNILEPQYFGPFTATDDDDDRVGDRLSTTEDFSIELVDDDISEPVILHKYTGDETDGNPGEIIVTASDASGLSVDPSGTYTVEPDLGPQDFTFIATDDDNDRVGDNLTATLVVPINIQDDDIEEPYFENLMITDDHLSLNISFTGIDDINGDDEGLSNVKVYVDGNLIRSDSSPSYETEFDFSFPNVGDWIWEPGIHNIQIDITDADNDRDSDSLSNTIFGQFEVTLDEMYQYVMWLCEEMNNYIYDNGIVALYGVVTQKLVKIQDLLWEAYQLIQDGYLHTGLVRQKMAEIKLEIADTKTELMINKQSMTQVHFDHLQECIRDVRNRIVELMGLSIGEFSHDISLVEIDVYNLRDFVEDNIPATDSENLVNAITLTAEKLENAIFDISLDKSTERSLTSAQNALDNVRMQVIALEGKGKITEVLKLTLLAKIFPIQVKIELLKDQI